MRIYFPTPIYHCSTNVNSGSFYTTVPILVQAPNKWFSSRERRPTSIYLSEQVGRRVGRQVGGKGDGPPGANSPTTQSPKTSSTILFCVGVGRPLEGTGSYSVGGLIVLYISDMVAHALTRTPRNVIESAPSGGQVQTQSEPPPQGPHQGRPTHDKHIYVRSPVTCYEESPPHHLECLLSFLTPCSQQLRRRVNSVALARLP